MNGKEFIEKITEQMGHMLQPSSSIKEFTTNPDITGAYAEACLRQFVSNVVAPLRVCTGGVISEQLCSKPKEVPQVDTVIWSPSPAPAIFTAGNFGLVPRGSVFGILEIKRSVYSKVGSDLTKQLDKKHVFRLVADICRQHYEGFLSQCTKNQSGTNSVSYPTFPALGVIVCQEAGQNPDQKLQELVKKGLAVVLLKKKNEIFTPNPQAIPRLVNFLVMTRKRARVMEGKELINIELQ